MSSDFSTDAAKDVFFDQQIARLRTRSGSKAMLKLVDTLAAIKSAALQQGDPQRWLAALAALPTLSPSEVELDSARLVIGDEKDLASAKVSPLTLRAQLEEFIPWRKGPFELFGIGIDTEWRCDLKWQRLADAITPLEGRTVLDVGSGNGYYSYRMAGAGAAQVLGIDPHIPYVAQFHLLQKFLSDKPVDVLPVTLDDFPARCGAFDTVFSMGVLYHRRSPIDHLLQLKDCLTSGGELVLETLVVEGDEGYCLTPQGPYARMKGIWFLPSVPTLMAWLSKAGFTQLELIDESLTNPDEQRATSWMPYASLEDAMDPTDPSKTKEGHPAPRRVVLRGQTPFS